jgi:hypothetical protein
MMKSLSERIAARAVEKNSPLQSHGDENQNRAVFLALRPDVKQALEDGWSIKSIWETLHEEGKVAFGYDAFRRYTKRLILLPAGQNPTPEHPGQSCVTRKTEPKTKETPLIAGFTFNPSPKKEDLF